MSCFTILVGILIIIISNALSLATPAKGKPHRRRWSDDNRNN